MTVYLYHCSNFRHLPATCQQTVWWSLLSCALCGSSFLTLNFYFPKSRAGSWLPLSSSWIPAPFTWEPWSYCEKLAFLELDLFILDVSCHPQCYRLDLLHKAPCYPLFTASCQLGPGNLPGTVNLVWIHTGGEAKLCAKQLPASTVTAPSEVHYHPHKNNHLLSPFCEHSYIKVCILIYLKVDKYIK